MDKNQKGYRAGLLGKLLLLWMGPVEGAYTWIGEACGINGKLAKGRVLPEQSRIGSSSV
jgi:hypothetical protein